MKLLVIGHTVKDIIQKPDETLIQPGGIYYTAAGLAGLKDDISSFTLVTALDDAHRTLYEDVYRHFDLRFVQHIENVPTVKLTIYPDKERTEEFLHLPGRLPLPIDCGIQFNGILINMISGYELNSNDVAVLKKEFKCPLYFDVHSLTRGTNNSLKRESTKVPDFHLWAQNIDILQANEYEILTLTVYDDEHKAVSQLLDMGIKAVIVTKGSLGARLYTKERNEVFSIFEKAPKKNVVNTVGCGDIFGASFFYRYSQSGNLLSALHYGITASSIITEYDSIKKIANLGNDIKRFLT